MQLYEALGNGSTIIGLLFIVQLGSIATMLADIWQNLPQIIKEAATSPLGLLALIRAPSPTAS